MTNQSVVQNAGRCDWCGKIISLAADETLVVMAEDDLGCDEYGISAADAADAIADALERVGGPQDAMLAETIREEVGYVVHDRCFDESALPELHTAVPGDTTDTDFPDH